MSPLTPMGIAQKIEEHIHVLNQLTTLSKTLKEDFNEASKVQFINLNEKEAELYAELHANGAYSERNNKHRYCDGCFNGIHACECPSPLMAQGPDVPEYNTVEVSCTELGPKLLNPIEPIAGWVVVCAYPSRVKVGKPTVSHLLGGRTYGSKEAALIAINRRMKESSEEVVFFPVKLTDGFLMADVVKGHERVLHSTYTEKAIIQVL